MRDKKLRQKLFGDSHYFPSKGGVIGKTMRKVNGLKANFTGLRKKFDKHVLDGANEIFDDIKANGSDIKEMKEDIDTIFSLFEQLHCEINEKGGKK